MRRCCTRLACSAPINGSAIAISKRHSRTRRSITRGANMSLALLHTNTIEGFWSIFKRGIVGTFHNVSKKYLHLYVAEFQFRYNNRCNADIFGTAIKGC